MGIDICHLSVVALHFQAGTARFLISSSCGFGELSLWSLTSEPFCLVAVLSQAVVARGH